jgi:hypothetical protein
LIEKDHVMNVNKPAVAWALTTVAAAVVAFGNPANASAANQNQPAAPQPTAGQCALISNMSPKNVLNLAGQEDQQAAFGQLLSLDAIQQCPVTVSYQELRKARGDDQQKQYLAGLIAATGGFALGAVVAVSALGHAFRGRE